MTSASRASWPTASARDVSPDSRGVVQRIITDLAVLDVTPTGLVLRELAPDVTEEEVRDRTEPDLVVDLQPAPTHG